MVIKIRRLFSFGKEGELVICRGHEWVLVMLGFLPWMMGHGYVYFLAIQRGAHLRCVDFSIEMLYLIKKKLREKVETHVMAGYV